MTAQQMLLLPQLADKSRLLRSIDAALAQEGACSEGLAMSPASASRAAAVAEQPAAITL